MAESVRTAHRVLHLLLACVLAASELAKVAYSRFQSRGYGYWWVNSSGFSVGDQGCGGVIQNAGCALGVTVVLLEIILSAIQMSMPVPVGRPMAFACHLAICIFLCPMAAADLALYVGAGGARVSLPLVLFALSETKYAFSVARPWMWVLVGSVLCIVAFVAMVALVLAALVRQTPQVRTPRTIKMLFFGLCSWRLVNESHKQEGVGADMLSQLGADSIAMWKGNFMSKPLDGKLSAHRVRLDHQKVQQYPPFLVFHWEAGGRDLLAQATAPQEVKTPVPFLRSLASSGQMSLNRGFVSMPMTLKSAWEVLCGMPPALTSDFREHGSALRRECLPRVLKECCGYRSILAKTDKELPDLPRRVFGFEEVIVAETNEELLMLIRKRLAELGALNGSVPVFLYFYAGDAHAPYTPDRVDVSELGYSNHTAEDVMFALHRRADRAAEALSEFWPPRPTEEGKWGPEHGLAIYFGDHGEVVRGVEPPPHGNLVSSQVSQVMLGVEGRSFFPRGKAPQQSSGVRRIADVFNTVTDVLSLQVPGMLHWGKSLLKAQGHATASSFSFYRPTELAAVHFQDASPSHEPHTIEFVRGPTGWISQAEGLLTDNNSAREQLLEANRFRDKVNTLLTESNVHAAWLLARTVSTLKTAFRVARRAIAKLLLMLPGHGPTAARGLPLQREAGTDNATGYNMTTQVVHNCKRSSTCIYEVWEPTSGNMSISTCASKSLCTSEEHCA